LSGGRLWGRREGGREEREGEAAAAGSRVSPGRLEERCEGDGAGSDARG
jgi:hypothetical protein